MDVYICTRKSIYDKISNIKAVKNLKIKEIENKTTKYLYLLII